MGLVISRPETLGDLISAIFPSWGVYLIGFGFAVGVGALCFFLIRNKNINNAKRKMSLILIGGICPVVGFFLMFLVWWIPIPDSWF